MKTDVETWFDQGDKIKSGKIKASYILSVYLDRIKRQDAETNAMVQVFGTRAMETANAVDSMKISGPLAGLCLVIKDMIDVKSGRCTGGLDYLKGRIPKSDADIVTRLRNLGAIVMGLSKTDNGGFGIRTPKVIHPLAPERIVGGSSGGSAAAVAAGYSPVALGTDSGGSIRIPAACCGLAGFKPTWGLLSMKGVLPFSQTMDHVGLLANNAADIRLVMEALLPANKPNLGKNSIEGIRIGVDPGFYDEADEAIKQAMMVVEKQVESLGSEIVRVSLPHPDQISKIHDPIVCREAADNHPNILEEPPESLDQVILETLNYASQVDPATYQEACQKQAGFQQEINELFETIDFLIIPTLPCYPPLKTDQMLRLGNRFYPLDMYLRRYTSLFNVSRNPAVSIPIVQIEPGVGISVQIAGPLNGDLELLSFASRIENLISQV